MTASNNKCFAISEIYGDNNEFEFLARIENYSKRCKWIAVGENITSSEFALLFPNSIGESRWKLLFYPNGQYLNGVAGKHVGIYLMLLSCDNEFKTLTADISFQIKAPFENQAVGSVIRKINFEFNYLMPGKRWYGHPKFEQMCVMHSQRYKRLFVNDTLTICCSIKESNVLSDSVPNGNASNVDASNESKLFFESGATNLVEQFDGKVDPTSSTWNADDNEALAWHTVSRKRKNGKRNERNGNDYPLSLESNSSNQCTQFEKAERMSAAPNIKKHKKPKRRRRNNKKK